MKEYLPADSMKLREMAGIKSACSIYNRESCTESYVLISTADQTSVLVPHKVGQFEEGTPDKYQFERAQETKAAFTLTDNKIV